MYTYINDQISQKIDYGKHLLGITGEQINSARTNIASYFGLEPKHALFARHVICAGVSAYLALMPCKPLINNLVGQFIAVFGLYVILYNAVEIFSKAILKSIVSTSIILAALYFKPELGTNLLDLLTPYGKDLFWSFLVIGTVSIIQYKVIQIGDDIADCIGVAIGGIFECDSEESSVEEFSSEESSDSLIEDIIDVTTAVSSKVVGFVGKSVASYGDKR